MNSFEVVSPIKVKGELIKPAKAGEQPNTVELSDKTAQLLLATKSIRAPSGEGHLAGAVTFNGQVIDLSQMKAEELKKLATDMGIEGAQKMNKADLVAAIKAVPVKPAE